MQQGQPLLMPVKYFFFIFLLLLQSFSLSPSFSLHYIYMSTVLKYKYHRLMENKFEENSFTYKYIHSAALMRPPAVDTGDSSSCRE